MIKIRTITYNLPETMTPELYDAVAACVEEWNKGEYDVHTQRIALPVQRNGVCYETLDAVAAFCRKVGIRWFNVPFDPWEDPTFSADTVTEVLSCYEGSFCNILCGKDKKVREEVLAESAAAICKVADICEDGSANFRLGISMNVAPNGPFFPFTHSAGNGLSFSVGLEITKDLNRLVSGGEIKDLNRLRKDIFALFEPQIQTIEKMAEEVSARLGIEFCGIDFSLAPLPEEGSSVIAILRTLGIGNMNDVGVLFVTAFLTNILKTLAARHKSVGFSGVMYSLLEDEEYARINNEEGMSIDKMIAMSTMCGCGVDMVPVDKDTAYDTLRTILLETACVSSRLNKPLGVRILPVRPNAEGMTEIGSDDDFIVNTRIVNSHINSLVPFDGVYSFVTE